MVRIGEIMNGLKETKWVGIVDTGDCVACIGVFDKLHEAVGKAYLTISEFSESYKGENDIFTIGRLTKDGCGGYFIAVDFKASCWEKSEQEVYRILPFIGE